MVAWSGLEKFKLGISDAYTVGDDNNREGIDVIARWPLGSVLDDDSAFKKPKK
jgi:hypothetical protein